MDQLQLYMVGLVVDDMDAALDFYRRLGVSIPDVGKSTHVEIEMAGGLKLFLDSRPDLWDPGYRPDATRGGGDSYRLLLEFYLETESEVRIRYDELVDHGYHGVRPPYQTPFGMCFAFVEDPDGNTVLISGEADNS